jgi:hypothetical protein
MYTIITREQCNFCDAAKALLKGSGYPYTEYNVHSQSSRWVLTYHSTTDIHPQWKLCGWLHGTKGTTGKGTTLMDDFPEKPTRSRRKTNYKGADKKSTSGLVAKTTKQKALIEALQGNKQVFILGPAGTGKTYVTATYASDLYTTKQIDKIVITRPHVAVGKELGFLKGDLKWKQGSRMATLRWHLLHSCVGVASIMPS